KCFYIFGHIAAEQYTQVLYQLEGQALCKTLKVFCTGDIIKRLQDCRDLMIHIAFNTRNGMFASCTCQLLVSKQNHTWLHDIVASSQTRNRITHPANETI